MVHCKMVFWRAVLAVCSFVKGRECLDDCCVSVHIANACDSATVVCYVIVVGLFGVVALCNCSVLAAIVCV